MEAIRINDDRISLQNLLQLSRLEDGLSIVGTQIRYSLVRQYADMHGIMADGEQIAAQLDDFRRRLGLHKTEAARQWLRNNGLTLEQVGQWIETKVLLEQVKAHVSDGKVEPFFMEHRLAFDRAKIRHLVVEEAGEASALLRELRDGRDFFALARAVSADAQTRDSGGYVGWVPRSGFSAEEEAAVFAAAEGSTCGPFPHGQRVRLIHVEKLRHAVLDADVSQLIREELFKEWLEERKRQSRIELPLLDRPREDAVSDSGPGGGAEMRPPMDGAPSRATDALRAASREHSAAAAGHRAGDEFASSRSKRGKRRRLLRYPVVIQQNAMDCGPACLAMICRFYGRRFGMNRLRQLVGVTRNGASMLQLAEAAETIGFACKGVDTGLDRLADRNAPFIAHWEGNHYMVVYHIDAGRVVAADPAIGLRKMTPAEFCRGWTGKVLHLEFAGQFNLTETPSRPWARYLPYFQAHRRDLSHVLVISLIVQVMGMAVPMFTQLIIDRVLQFQDRSLLNIMFVGMLFITVVTLLFNASREYLVAFLFQRIDVRMVTDFYRKVLTLPLAFFKERQIGDVLTRVEEHKRIRLFLTTSSIEALLNALTIVVFSTLMFVYSPRLAGIALLFIPLFAGLILIVTPYMKNNSRKQFQANVAAQNKMVEAIGAVETIKALAVERKVRRGITERLEQEAKVRMDGAVIRVVSGSLGAVLQQLSGASILYLGALLVIHAELSLGQLMAFTFMYSSLLGAASGLIGLWDQFQNVRVSIERLDDVYAAPSDEEAGEAAIRLSDLEGHIVFERLSFRYAHTARNVLQNIHLEILPGQTVALVGRSGAGKSSIAHLLLKLYEPSGGKLTIDGFDLRRIDPGCLRSSIGVVQQDAVLFGGTIRENIAYRNPDASFEEIVAAAKAAEAHAFIMALPDGYELRVGERGTALSGGQRQRIAIARALLGHPRMLILDEATSALDSESERRIYGNIGQWSGNRTTLIIAHRLSTVCHADRIVVLDQGMVAESGTHEELLSAKGLYHHLYRQQSDGAGGGGRQSGAIGR